MAWSTDPYTSDLKKDEAIIIEAKARYRICEEWESQARVWYELDIKFANGDSRNMYQWDEWVIGDRISTNRPCLTINKTNQHNLLIINDAKQNKPGINIRPVGDNASFEAAQVFQEVVRHVEYISSAENVYDNATVTQVQGGMGYWRVQTDYISAKSHSQEIYIKRIKDPRSVYLDPDITEVDGSDSRFGFIFEDNPRDLYNAKYPDFKDVGGSTLFSNTSDGWATKDIVRVAEYYRKTQKKETACSFTDPNTGKLVEEFYSKLTPEQKKYYDDRREYEKDLPPIEHTCFERPSVSDDIEWFKIAGNSIIDRGPWLGKYIPIVRLVGTETVIDGVLDRKGHTRALLDAQRMYNINTSSNVEFGALQSKVPWLAPMAAVEGLEEYWKPLALDTPLPTPNGWTTMGEVKIGDWLFDENGKPVQVMGMSPIHFNRKCYKVEFDDGSVIVADEDHLWTIERRKRKAFNADDWMTCTIPTKLLEVNKDHIWCAKSFELDQKDLIIDPYVLGYWLGDGSSASNRIHCSIDDCDEAI